MQQNVGEEPGDAPILELHSLKEHHFVHTVAMNADISMQNTTLVVSEDMASIDICAVINGVGGLVEEEVTATLITLPSTTMTGNGCTYIQADLMQ